MRQSAGTSMNIVYASSAQRAVRVRLFLTLWKPANIFDNVVFSLNRVRPNRSSLEQRPVFMNRAQIYLQCSHPNKMLQFASLLLPTVY